MNYGRITKSMEIEELNTLLAIPKESETIEFKECKTQISILGGQNKERKSLYGYCVALGNEDGGKLVLGVGDKINKKTHKRPIVGTNAIGNIPEAKSQIYSHMGVRIDIKEFVTKDGRVLVISVPPRSIGQYFKFYGVGLMRVDDQLQEMNDQTIQYILNEGMPDFSAEICEGITIKDLDPLAINTLKEKWAKKSENPNFKDLKNDEALKKLLLMRSNKLTYAALLLLGKEDIIGQFLPSSEYILEWRSEPKKTSFDYRKIWRNSFILIYDEIWETINARNIRFPFKTGFIETDIWAFKQQTVREALLNAFGHREYRNRVEPVFIKLTPESFVIKSPGGFLPGVSAKNALHAEGKWRNRLLMEVSEKIGLVERAGVGLDRIYTETIINGKGLPRFDDKDISNVVLEIPAKVKDIKFVRYLQDIASKGHLNINENEVDDIVFLENIRTEGKSEDEYRKNKFLEMGIIEKYGQGPGLKYILSKNYYEFIENKGAYTRKKWLNKVEQKELVIKFLQDHKQAQLTDFLHPHGLFEGKLSKDQIKSLLRELREEGRIFFDGPRRSSKGFWRLKV